MTHLASSQRRQRKSKLSSAISHSLVAGKTHDWRRSPAIHSPPPRLFPSVLSLILTIYFSSLFSSFPLNSSTHTSFPYFLPSSPSILSLILVRFSVFFVFFLRSSTHSYLCFFSFFLPPPFFHLFLSVFLHFRLPSLSVPPSTLLLVNFLLPNPFFPIFIYFSIFFFLLSFLPLFIFFSHPSPFFQSFLSVSSLSSPFPFPFLHLVFACPYFLPLRSLTHCSLISLLPTSLRSSTQPFFRLFTSFLLSSSPYSCHSSFIYICLPLRKCSPLISPCFHLFLLLSVYTVILLLLSLRSHLPSNSPYSAPYV